MLRTLIPLEGADRRLISDARHTISAASLLRAPATPTLVDQFYGQSVLLALPDQVSTIAALVQLDGLARRIILWPYAELTSISAAVLETGEVGVTVKEWPAFDPVETGCSAGNEPPSGQRSATGRLETEWILLTSGTTSEPKLVQHTLHSLTHHLQGRKPLSPNISWATFYDIRRYGGLQVMLRSLIGGTSLLLTSGSENLDAFLRRAGAAGTTHFLGTPSHWRRVLLTSAANQIQPSYVRLSGEVIDQSILNRLREAYPTAQIVHAFASTEAGLGFEVTDGQAGFPQDCLGWNEDTRADLCIAEGTLRFRSEGNAARYLGGMPLIDATGYVDTGDGVSLRGGRYYFTGRRGGVINVGGSKVYPEEVEEVINLHPSVDVSVVAGRHNAITGAVVVAQVISHDAELECGGAGSRNTRLRAEIRALCRSRLEPYKVPAIITFTADLRITSGGKLGRQIG